MQKKVDTVVLPVSIGEAIDKLTILAIQLQKVTDSQEKSKIQTKFDALNKKLNPILEDYQELYHIMLKMNLAICDATDALRDPSLSNEEYIRISKKCVECSDIWVRVRNKFNYSSNAANRQRIGHSVKVVAVRLSNEIDNIDEFVRPIKYLSFLNDTVVILSNNSALKKVFSSSVDIVFEEQAENYHSMHEFPNATYTKAEIYSILGIREAEVDELLGQSNISALEDIKEPADVPVAEEPVTKLDETTVVEEHPVVEEPVTKLDETTVVEEHPVAEEPVTKLDETTVAEESKLDE